MKDKNKDIKTKIVFINIYSDKLFEKQLFTLNVANTNTKEKITSKEYVHNSTGIIDMKAMNNTEVCFYSKDTLGIPIFISYDNVDYLSVEHTHPPAEYFWNNNDYPKIRNSIVNKNPPKLCTDRCIIYNKEY